MDFRSAQSARLEGVSDSDVLALAAQEGRIPTHIGVYLSSLDRHLSALEPPPKPPSVVDVSWVSKFCGRNLLSKRVCSGPPRGSRHGSDSALPGQAFVELLHDIRDWAESRARLVPFGHPLVACSLTPGASRSGYKLVRGITTTT